MPKSGTIRGRDLAAKHIGLRVSLRQKAAFSKLARQQGFSETKVIYDLVYRWMEKLMPQDEFEKVFPPERHPSEVLSAVDQSSIDRK